MKCPQCETEGKRSTVTPGGGMTTCLGWTPYTYDEDGDLVQHKNPNTTFWWYSCSNGHSWQKSSREE